MSNTTKASSNTSAKKDDEKPVIAAVPTQTQGPDEEIVEVFEGQIVDSRPVVQKVKAALKNKKALAAMTGAVVAGSLLLIVRLRNNAAGVETEVEDETLSA